MSITDLNIPGKFAITIDGLFTPEECAELIQHSESNHFSTAAVNLGGTEATVTEIRNSSRWMADDPALAARMFLKLKSYIPSTWANRPVSGLNERLRFLRYHPGQYFKPHYDGAYERMDLSEKSYITVQIYLNGGDALGGGETTFLKDDGEKGILASVKPSPGKVLIFEHEILHEGGTVTEGIKYVIRTDVMYRRIQQALTNEDMARDLMTQAVMLEAQQRHQEAIASYKRAFRLCPELEKEV